MLLTFSLFASSDYDKDIIVLDQSRDDKVKIVFSDMMQFYEEEDSSSFFSYVSEDRFIQDFMTFTEAIDEDFRKYEIISFDSWIEKITSDGVKRYLYVKWEKRYETNLGGNQTTKTGYSRFLFDEINGEYKLIELAGNNLWGDSLAEWRDEVPTIPGQEIYDEVSSSGTSGLPDLKISAVCPSGEGGAMPMTLTISNIGSGPTTLGYIAYEAPNFFSMAGPVFNNDLDAGESVNIDITADCYDGNIIIVDPDDLIEEEKEGNNTFSLQVN